jgi:hypothetical protein
MDGVYVGCQDARFVRRATKCAWLIATPTAAPGLIATVRTSSLTPPHASPTKIVAGTCSSSPRNINAPPTRWHRQRRLRRLMI